MSTQSSLSIKPTTGTGGILMEKWTKNLLRDRYSSEQRNEITGFFLGSRRLDLKKNKNNKFTSVQWRMYLLYRAWQRTPKYCYRDENKHVVGRCDVSFGFIKTCTDDVRRQVWEISIFLDCCTTKDKRVYVFGRSTLTVVRNYRLTLIDVPNGLTCWVYHIRSTRATTESPRVVFSFVPSIRIIFQKRPVVSV